MKTYRIKDTLKLINIGSIIDKKPFQTPDAKLVLKFFCITITPPIQQLQYCSILKNTLGLHYLKKDFT